MATVRDVAKKAGVSVTTVSRVINDHPYVRKETRQKVEAAMREMAFVPNVNAGNLARKTTSTVAVLVPDITNTFFTTLVRGIEDEANARGLLVLLGNTDEDGAKEQNYIQKFLERRVDGLIIVPAEEEGNNLAPILRRDLPLVLVDRRFDGVETAFVGSDNVRGARMLVGHLLEQGHRRIVMIAGPRKISVFRERAEGFMAALEEAGAPAETANILYGSKPNRDTGLALTRSLLDRAERPTAIFAANNSLAAGAVLALRQAGLQVPRHLSVACFDDNDANAFNPFFTSVVQPAYRMGLAAAAMLIDAIRGRGPGDCPVVFQTELILRRSTAPPAGDG